MANTIECTLYRREVKSRLIRTFLKSYNKPIILSVLGRLLFLTQKGVLRGKGFS